MRYILNVTEREKGQGGAIVGTLGRAVEIAMEQMGYGPMRKRIKTIVEGFSVSCNVYVISIKKH